MQQIDRERVQPGWSVWTSDGEELGRVIQVEQDAIRVRKQGLFASEMSLPKDVIREVEEGRVEVSLTKDEASAAR